MFGNDTQQQNDDTTSDPTADATLDQTLPTVADDSNPAAPPAGTFGSPSTIAPAATNDLFTPTAPAGTDELIALKQEALQALSPLVNHLDQSPEEKFKTTMMMIQASDDQSLLKTAHETAKLIPDEKARAQALLDVINEINYFTQQHNNG